MREKMLEIATRLRRRAGEEEMHVETSDALIEVADVIEEVLSGDCEHRWVQRPGFQNTFCDRCGSFPGPESLDNIRQNGERESGEEVSN